MLPIMPKFSGVELNKYLHADGPPSYSISVNSAKDSTAPADQVIFDVSPARGPFNRNTYREEARQSPPVRVDLGSFDRAEKITNLFDALEQPVSPTITTEMKTTLLELLDELLDKGLLDAEEAEPFKIKAQEAVEALLIPGLKNQSDSWLLLGHEVSA